ncbi:MAG: PAS domain S-box protein [Puniceicoccaceae bacterium]|nr:PAS domain S-box protein [Puniceicoccaceae bacterium]
MPSNEPHTIRILLFEYCAADADLVAEYLDHIDLNFNISIVKRLADGIHLLDQNRFDVILLDLSLPDSRGIDSLRSVMKVASEAVIIVLTGADEEELSLEALQVGAQDYLYKDRLNEEILGRSIRYAIERFNLKRQLETHNTEIQYRETLLRRIFDANTDAMLILGSDYDIKFLNPAAGELMEAEPERLVGEVFPFEIKGGEVTELEIPDLQNKTRIVELSAVDLIWEGESALLVILRDITLRRSAELALKHEKERLSATLDTIVDAVITTDQSGAVERLNEEAARLVGMTQKESLGRPLEEVLKIKHPRTGKPIKDLTRTLMDPEFADAFTEVGVPLDSAKGRTFYVTAETRCILDDGGGTTRLRDRPARHHPAQKSRRRTFQS